MNENISVSTGNDDKPLLHNANSEFEDITVVESDHNWNGTKIKANSLSLSLQKENQLTSKILPIIDNRENKVSLVCMVKFFSKFSMCAIHMLNSFKYLKISENTFLNN